MSVYVGLDIGGTKVMAAAADRQGRILRRARRPSVQPLEAGLAILDQMIVEVADGQPIMAIGAAAGGPLDWQTGVVSPLHQPAWRAVPLRQIMEERWSCPFYVDVDTNLAALAEYALGGARVARLLYLTLSTGMGGGFLIDGRIYRGAGGAHPEVAHQSIPYRCSNPAGLACECGLPDCLEALVSGNGIRRVYGKPAEHLSPDEWAEVAYNLGQGLRNLAAIYTPDLIRIGGGVAVGGGPAFVEQARQIMAAHLRLVPVPGVSLSRLGRDTALHGALIIAARGRAALE